MDCHQKPQYISELAHLFLCSYTGHIDTGAFMTRLTEILSDERNQGKYPYFDLFVCTKGQQKLSLHKHMIYDKSQILYHLFDLCGCKGYDVYMLTDEGSKGVGGTTRFFYGIWIYTSPDNKPTDCNTNYEIEIAH